MQIENEAKAPDIKSLSMESGCGSQQPAQPNPAPSMQTENEASAPN